jgi:hypothetical protein
MSTMNMEFLILSFSLRYQFCVVLFSILKQFTYFYKISFVFHRFIALKCNVNMFIFHVKIYIMYFHDRICLFLCCFSWSLLFFFLLLRFLNWYKLMWISTKVYRKCKDTSALHPFILLNRFDQAVLLNNYFVMFGVLKIFFSLYIYIALLFFFSFIHSSFFVLKSKVYANEIV